MQQKRQSKQIEHDAGRGCSCRNDIFERVAPGHLEMPFRQEQPRRHVLSSGLTEDNGLPPLYTERGH